MFQTVAIPFDAYAALPPVEFKLGICLARYSDRTARCFPTERQLARDVGISPASVCRYLKRMEARGVFQRERRPGGRYVYTLAEPYRLCWPGRKNPRSSTGVSAAGNRVSQVATQEAKPLKQVEKGYEVRDDSAQWVARIRGWRNSGGRFWNPFWGPKPSEPGCWAPAALLSTG